MHRDLKPGNILVTREGAGPEGRVCVIDFGIAKLIAEDDDESVTSTGEFLEPPLHEPRAALGRSHQA